MDRGKPAPLMNPYLAGVLLGLVLVAAIFISGRGLGASGALKNVVVATVETVSPQRVEQLPAYSKYLQSHPGSIFSSWLFFEVIGVMVGALLSAVIARRAHLVVEKGKGIKNRTRIIAAILGGACFGYGAQLARGCTSGAALSGMAVLSFGGILTMMAIFGSAYAFAWFFRGLWRRN